MSSRWTLLWITLITYVVVGDDRHCTRLRVPPTSIEYELVHILSFDNAFEQAQNLVTAWNLPAYKTPLISKQLLDAMAEMADHTTSEALVNLTLDHTLTYDITIAGDGSMSKDQIQPIVMTPEEPVNETVALFCERYDVVDCNALYAQLYPLVARDWGCYDNETVADEPPTTNGPALVEIVLSDVGLTHDELPQPSKDQASTALPHLRVHVGNETQHLTIQADLDLELQAAVFCRQWLTPMNECANVLHAMQMLTDDHPAFINTTRRNRGPRTPSGLALEITDPVLPRLYPISERVYFNSTWYNESTSMIDERQRVCLFYGYAQDPQLCGFFPPDEMWFFERYRLAEGYHIVYFAEPPDDHQPHAPQKVLAARHFWVVTPTVKFLDVQLRTLTSTVVIVLEIETMAFDVFDPEFRVCALVDDDLECFQHERLHIREQTGVYHQRKTVFRAPIFGVRSGKHAATLLLLNSYNKVIAHSTTATFQVIVAPFMTLEPRNASYFFEPSSVGHVQRPSTCPHSLAKTGLDWICNLWQHEWGRYSQNGEDGILQSIFHHIDATNRFYVEFGTEDATECNTRFLREMHDWSGLLLDGSHANTTINLQQEWISPENINELFAKYDVPREFDVLSIDVDFNDYWILNAIDRTRFSPRVIIIEVNSHVAPTEPRVVKYQGPTARWDGKTAYFGVGVGALDVWGKRNGYSLVYCESHGVNCFLVRNDVLASVTIGDDELVVSDVLTSEDLYAPPNFFGRNVDYPWPTPESGIVEEWVWLEEEA